MSATSERMRSVATGRGGHATSKARRILATAVPVLGIAVVSACDIVFTEPAPALDEVAVFFTVEGSAEGGVIEAFDKVNRVFLRFTRADSAQRDTIVAVTNRNGEARARLVLDPQERISALGIYAELRAGNAALFVGSRIVRVESGVPTSATISLTPIPAVLRPDRQAAVFPKVGDTLRLGSAVLFASGDTIPGIAGRWVSEDATIVAITPAGIALARSVGQTRLLVQYGDLQQVVTASVLANR